MKPFPSNANFILSRQLHPTKSPLRKFLKGLSLKNYFKLCVHAISPCSVQIHEMIVVQVQH